MQCCQQQRARALFGEELAGAATGAADELRGGQGHRDHHRQVGAPLLGPLVLQLRRQLRDRRLANELAVAVDRPRRDAACGDLREQRVHLARRHIGRGAVAERGHDLGAERSRPTAVRRAGLRQRVAVLAQRRRLGVSHMLEPVQVRVGDLAEGDRRVGGALPRQRPLAQVALGLAHEPVLGDDRGLLVEVAGLGAAAAAADLAVIVLSLSRERKVGYSEQAHYYTYGDLVSRSQIKRLLRDMLRSTDGLRVIERLMLVVAISVIVWAVLPVLIERYARHIDLTTDKWQSGVPVAAAATGALIAFAWTWLLKTRDERREMHAVARLVDRELAEAAALLDPMPHGPGKRMWDPTVLLTALDPLPEEKEAVKNAGSLEAWRAQNAAIY